MRRTRKELSMDGKKVIELLRKLVSHEKSARTVGNIHEAEAFAARIQTLLSEHKLGMTDVEFAEREAGEPIDWEYVDPAVVGFHGKRAKVAWQVFIANAIASANTCETVLANGNKLYFVGRTTDRELCRVFFLYLLEMAKQLAETDAITNMDEQRRLFKKERGFQFYYPPRRFLAWMFDYRKAWYNGFSMTVGERLEQKAKEAEKAANPNAIIHISKDRELVKAEVAENSKPLSYSGRLGRNQAAFQRGAEAGSTIALTPHRFGHSKNRATALLGA